MGEVDSATRTGESAREGWQRGVSPMPELFRATYLKTGVLSQTRFGPKWRRMRTYRLVAQRGVHARACICMRAHVHTLARAHTGMLCMHASAHIAVLATGCMLCMHCMHALSACIRTCHQVHTPHALYACIRIHLCTAVHMSACSAYKHTRTAMWATLYIHMSLYMGDCVYIRPVAT